MSLLEEVLVIAIIAVVIFFALPAARQLFNSLETPAGTKSLISSALASARAIASREQQYVGIRFQHACYIDEQGNIQPNQSPLKMPQYMIFVKYQPPKQAQNNDNHVFVAIEGIEPIKLPENIGVMDMVINKNQMISSDADIDSDTKLLDTTSFFIVFSPSGKLSVQESQTRNKNGYASSAVGISEDDIFNIEEQVEKGYAKFVQDENGIAGLEQEPSRRAFIIYDRNILRSLHEAKRYSRYLEDLKNREMIYINPYTGTFINK
ncbi:MAG: hypothetical protein WC374_13680 [Phycisphaerae bacterium]